MRQIRQKRLFGRVAMCGSGHVCGDRQTARDVPSKGQGKLKDPQIPIQRDGRVWQARRGLAAKLHGPLLPILQFERDLEALVREAVLGAACLPRAAQATAVSSHRSRTVSSTASSLMLPGVMSAQRWGRYA